MPDCGVAREVIIDALKDDDEQIRHCAANLLMALDRGELFASHATALQRLEEHDDPNVRRGVETILRQMRER